MRNKSKGDADPNKEPVVVEIDDGMLSRRLHYYSSVDQLNARSEGDGKADPRNHLERELDGIESEIQAQLQEVRRQANELGYEWDEVLRPGFPF